MMASLNVAKNLKNFIGGSFICAAASMTLIGDACAADWETIRKAVPEAPDLTWNGITFIGAIDVGVQYASHGTRYNGMSPTSIGIVYPTNTGPKWAVTNNQSIQSYIGLKVDRPLTDDLNFIARLEAGVVPTSGLLADGLKTLQQNNGVAPALQFANADSPRAGQIFNGDAWAGFNSKQWVQIRFGRNTAVSTDMLAAYDPLLSYGFSLYGYVGYIAGGGTVETVKIDQSVKYLHQIGSIRTEIVYGEPGTNVGKFYQGSIGIVRPEFSIDVFGGKSTDSISAAALSGAANVGSQYLGARVYDTTTFGIFGKYAFDLGGKGYSDPNSAKFILSGGYTRLDFSNPADGGLTPGHTTIGGYQIGPIFSTNGSNGFGVVNYAYTGGDRVIDTFFVGAKYQHDARWSVAATYTIYSGNSFGFGVNSIPGIVAASYSNTSCSSNKFTNCSGNEQVAALRVDYDWNKNLKLYSGITFSQVNGGFAFGYIHPNEIAPTVGMRYTF